MRKTVDTIWATASTVALCGMLMLYAGATPAEHVAGTLEVKLVQRIDPRGPVLDLIDGCFVWGGIMTVFQQAAGKGVPIEHYRKLIDSGETRFDGMKTFLHQSLTSAYAQPDRDAGPRDTYRWTLACRDAYGESWTMFPRV